MAHADVPDRLLTGSVAVLAAEGLVDLEAATMATDGMSVRASAGRDSFHRRPTLEEAIGPARALVERLRSERDRGEAAGTTAR